MPTCQFRINGLARNFCGKAPDPSPHLPHALHKDHTQGPCAGIELQSGSRCNNRTGRPDAATCEPPAPLTAASLSTEHLPCQVRFASTLVVVLSLPNKVGGDGDLPATELPLASESNGF